MRETVYRNAEVQRIETTMDNVTQILIEKTLKIAVSYNSPDCPL